MEARLVAKQYMAGDVAPTLMQFAVQMELVFVREGLAEMKERKKKLFL